eukprot:TRINITY_DN47331_c0_g1_i1.p1 TRINITY_DN47331_c0_g1~~TRINITY_DN47331_c0_g1_i1.p1  ORF type:complete len:2477 (+),score=908.43 TRINITY_DN47331_c0_g1_i1:64-7494(+)
MALSGSGKRVRVPDEPQREDSLFRTVQRRMTRGVENLGLLVGDLVSGSRPADAGGYVPVARVRTDEHDEPHCSYLTVRPTEPFVSRTTASEHPDTLLRRMGIIEQEGIIVRNMKRVPVYYDWLRRGADGEPEPAWCRRDRPGEPLDAKVCSEIKNRRDVVNTGVVRLVGHIDFHHLVRKEQDSKRRHKNRNAQHDTEPHLKSFLEHRKKKRAADRKPQAAEVAQASQGVGLLADSDQSSDDLDGPTAENTQAKQTEADRKRVVSLQQQGFVEVADGFLAGDGDALNIVDVEEDGDLLSTGDVIRIVRQYLQRSIPRAAIATGSVVTTSGAGDIPQALGKGVAAISEGDQPAVPVIGVHPWHPSLEDDEAMPHDTYELTKKMNLAEARKKRLERKVYREAVLNPNFTHHVLVKKANPLDPAGTGLVLPRPDDETPSNKTMLDVTIAMVGELARGFNTADVERNADITKGGTPLPPPRQPCRVCTVLFGGNKDTTKYDLIHSVRRRWPILVVEGTGGYADVISERIRNVELISDGAPTADDYKRSLSEVDALTAQIICDGDLRIIAKGTLPEAFSREVQRAITGDETLNRAWEKYAAWNEQANTFQKQYMWFMLVILILGILATTLSITQTLLQLQYPDQTVNTPANTSNSWFSTTDRPVAIVYGSINIAVIVLPIAIQLVQHIANNVANAGPKWVSLRSAAERTLTEIYMYRTRTRSYSAHAVQRAKERLQKQQRGAVGVAAAQVEEDEGIGDDAEPESPELEGKGGEALEPTDNRMGYSSRSELLHIRLKKRTQELIESEVAADAIPQYKGFLPPKHIFREGDDGFSDLSPQEYVDLRLAPKIKQYHKDAKRLDKFKSRVNYMIYGWGAIGTALAALATYDNLKKYNLGAWVALTTSIGNALTRFLDYMRTEWLHRKYTSTMYELQRFESWWASRGTDGDTCKARDELMGGCEGSIMQEVAEFKQQLRIATEEAKKEADIQQAEREQIKKDLESGNEPELVKKMEDIGISNLNVDSMEAILKDPDGPAAQQMKLVLQRLDTEFGGVVEKAKKTAERTRLGQELTKHISKVTDIAQGCLDPAGNIINGAKMAVGPLDLVKLIPKDVQDFAKDPSKRRALLSEIDPRRNGTFDPRQLTYSSFMQITENMKQTCTRQLVNHFQAMPYRMGIESLQSVAKKDLQQEFDKVLGKVGLRSLDLIENRDAEDDLMAEMRKLASLPWSTMSRKSLLASVTNVDIRDSLKRIGESKMRGVLKRAELTFVQSSPSLELLRTTQNITADMDLDRMLSEETRCSVLESLDALQFNDGSKIPEVLMDKDEILSIFPKDALVGDVMENLQRLPHTTLTTYVERLRHGSLGSRMLDTWLAAPEFVPGANIPIRDFGHHVANRVKRQVVTTGRERLQDHKKLEVLLSSTSGKEKFVTAAKRFTQIEINTLAKSAMLKKTQNLAGFDMRMTEQMKLFGMDDMKGLRMVMSGLRATFGNSYSGRMFDLLTDELTGFDANLILTDFEDREKLVSRMQDFKGETMSDTRSRLQRMTKAQILSLLGYRTLVSKCSVLSVEQLRELVERLLAVMGNGFNKRVFEKALEELERTRHGVGAHPRMEVFRDAGLHSWNEQTVDRFVSQVLEIDPAMLDPDETPKDEAEFRKSVLGDQQLIRLTSPLEPSAICHLVLRIQDFGGDRVIANIFDSCLGETAAFRELHVLFDAAFSLPPVRHRVVMCITNLLMERGPAGQDVIIPLTAVTESCPDLTLWRMRQPVTFPSRRFCHHEAHHWAECFVCSCGKPGEMRDTATARWVCRTCAEGGAGVPECPCRRPTVERRGGALQWVCRNDDAWVGPPIEEPDPGTFGNCPGAAQCSNCKRKGKDAQCLKLLDTGIIVSRSLRSVVEARCSAKRSRQLIGILAKIFRTKELLAKQIEFILGELNITASYRMFLQLSIEIRSFNLREVVTSMRSRQCLCPLLLRLVWNQRLSFSPEPPHVLKSVKVAPQSEDGYRYGPTDGSESDLVSVDPVQPTADSERRGKEAIIRLCDEFDDAGMEVVTNDLQNLTLQQLRQLIATFYNYVRNDFIGIYFQFLERSIVLHSNRKGKSFGGNSRKWQLERTIREESTRRARDEAIAVVKNTFKRDPQLVLDRLDSFDARVFSNRLQADKKRRLEDLEVKNEGVSADISTYSEQDVKQFFAYIKNTPRMALGRDLKVMGVSDELRFALTDDAFADWDDEKEEVRTAMVAAVLVYICAGHVESTPGESSATCAVFEFVPESQTLPVAIGCLLMGTTVEEVTPGSIAHKAGVKPGWVITELGPQMIGVGAEGERDLAEAFAAARKDVPLRVRAEEEDEIPLLNTVTLGASRKLPGHWVLDEDASRRDGVPLKPKMWLHLRTLARMARHRASVVDAPAGFEGAQTIPLLQSEDFTTGDFTSPVGTAEATSPAAGDLGTPAQDAQLAEAQQAEAQAAEMAANVTPPGTVPEESPTNVDDGA